VQYGERVVSEVGCEKVCVVLEEFSKRHAGVRLRLPGLSSVYPRHDKFMAKVCEFDAAGLALAPKRLSFMTHSKVPLFWIKLTD
jgi:hypothetical protein